MQKVLTAAEMREVDHLTTEKYGIPSILLMENAAHAVARVITEKLGGSVKGKRIVVLCGKGNNGGDGAALARILWTEGADCFVELFGTVDETKGDARTNFDVLKRISESRETNAPDENCLFINESTDFIGWDIHRQNYAAIVDAVFGTGLTRSINDDLAKLFKQFRRSKDASLFVSVDVPSGLGEGIGSNDVFPAEITVTFTAPKPANVLASESGFNGELIVADIGSPRELIDAQPSQLYLAEKQDAADWLYSTAFSADSYKNKRGHSLIIAGSREFSGAAVLAGNSAMRSGVGLVTLVTAASSKDVTASRTLPEVMVRGVAETESGAVAEDAYIEIEDLLKKADSIAIGSGMSQNESTKRFVEKVVFESSVPVVVDADALNLLSPFGENSFSETPHSAFRNPHSLILTPHEGEFLRLLGENHPDAEASPLLRKEGSLGKDRVAAVREFAQKHNVILVLKGERVLIGEPGGKVVVNPTGNSGIGKAGNGDTLTGIIAGFAAQAQAMKIDLFETVVAAVYIAGMAGDVAEKKFGKRVMTASDVRECLTDVFAEFEANSISN